MKRVAVLGSTGFIGRETLDVVRMHSDKLCVSALTAHRNTKLFLEQVAEFRPEVCGVTYPAAAEEVRAQIPEGIRFYAGADAIEACAGDAQTDIVTVAIVGIAGLPAVMAGIRAGHDIALANKEALITGGALVVREARERNVRILPVDSEHSAIFQCLQANRDRTYLEKILLTASGGPFRTWTREQIAAVTPEQALKHPTWNMGAKITIDSATMMNKGLEIMEAGWLFGVARDRIQVVVHPQSIIHSAVMFSDHSVIAQMGVADMRIPIQYALLYPERPASPAQALDLFSLSALTFERPDEERFPCLKLATQAMLEGGLAPTVLNAANEIAVEAFLDHRIGFYEIPELIGEMLSLRQAQERTVDIETVYETDRRIRAAAGEAIRRRHN